MKNHRYKWTFVEYMRTINEFEQFGKGNPYGMAFLLINGLRAAPVQNGQRSQIEVEEIAVYLVSL